MMTRRFLVSPALARLIRQHRGSTSIIEGYFEQQPGRDVLLRITGGNAQLVLSTPRHSKDPEEAAAEIPTAHADALLMSCAGKTAFEQSSLALPDGQEVLARGFNGLNAFATVSVTFADQDVADRFVMPSWFGSEVTDDDAYAHRGLALNGIPRLGEVSISDPALNAVLDLLDKQPVATREQASAEVDDMRPNGLPQEIAAALTEEMERAITGTTEEEAEVDSEPVHGSEEEQTVDAVPHLARPEFRFGQLRPGFPMTRTGFRREEQTQNVATGS